MEQCSRAYVQAVAATAGCTTARPEVDDDSVDLILKRKTVGTPVRSPQLDVQIKSTGRDCIGEKDVSFALKRKNYDELRDPDLAVPRILIVVVMPPNIEHWLDHDEGRLAIKKCCYWISLLGEPEYDQQSVTVTIPRSQLFNVQSVDAIFTRLAAGGLP